MSYISGGIYGYGVYGTSLYGRGSAFLDDESIVISDVISRLLTIARNMSESMNVSDSIDITKGALRTFDETLTLTEVFSGQWNKPERNKIFINGNMVNGGIPIISNLTNASPIIRSVLSSLPIINGITNSSPTIKNVTNGIPQFRRSLPYGYGA